MLLGEPVREWGKPNMEGEEPGKDGTSFVENLGQEPANYGLGNQR